jgi:hypothetical protein
VKNLVYHAKAKHIGIHCHYVHEQMQEGMVMVKCRTEDQVVDIFTKPLSKLNFVKFRGMLGLKKVVLKWSVRSQV